MAESTIQTDPGYGFLEEGMAVEEDHMGEGALRFTLVGLVLLLIMIVVVIGWARHEGPVAADQNAVYEPSPILRQAEANASDKLNNFGVVEPDSGRWRIPIERAMALIASENTAQADREE